MSTVMVRVLLVGLLCGILNFETVQGRTLAMAAHANDLVKAFEQVEEMYREGQPRPPPPSFSPSPSPSVWEIFSNSTSPSPSISFTPNPSPSPSALPLNAPLAAGEIRTRDIVLGKGPDHGDVLHGGGKKPRRYPSWFPNGQNYTEPKPYQWLRNHNRYAFLRKGKEIPFAERDFPDPATSTVVISDDPEHILNMFGNDRKMVNGSGEVGFVNPRLSTQTVNVGPAQTSSRRVGDVHRYLGYVPISRVWTGHPYFDNIRREARPCNFSRSFNCVSKDEIPLPSVTPTVSVTPSPSIIPSPSSTPSVSPANEPDLGSLMTEEQEPPPFLTGPSADGDVQPAQEEEEEMPLPPPPVIDEEDIDFTAEAEEPDKVGEEEVPPPEEPALKFKSVEVEATTGTATDTNAGAGEVSGSPKSSEDETTKQETTATTVTKGNNAATDSYEGGGLIL